MSAGEVTDPPVNVNEYFLVQDVVMPMHESVSCCISMKAIARIIPMGKPRYYGACTHTVADCGVVNSRTAYSHCPLSSLDNV